MVKFHHRTYTLYNEATISAIYVAKLLEQVKLKWHANKETTKQIKEAKKSKKFNPDLKT